MKSVEVSAATLSREIPIDQPLRMNDRQPQGAQFTRDAAARREQVFEHQAKRNLMLGKLLRADAADAVFYFAFREHIDDAAAASFPVAVGIAADRLGLLAGFFG